MKFTALTLTFGAAVVRLVVYASMQKRRSINE